MGGIAFIGQVIEGLDAKNLRGLVEDAKKKMGSGVAVLIAVNEGKGSVATGVTDDLTGKYSAVELVRVAASAMGGQGGGGRADMAQAGGRSRSSSTWRWRNPYSARMMGEGSTMTTPASPSMMTQSS